MKSRRIVISISRPRNGAWLTKWHGDPYSNQEYAPQYLHQQEYEIRILDQRKAGGYLSCGRVSVKTTKLIKANENHTHWFDLPQEIRSLWDSTF